MENMFTLKPSVKEKISTAFNRSKEGSLSDFYKLLETRFSTGKDTDIENVIKETMYKEGLFKTFEEYIKVNVEKAYEKKDTRVNAITTVQEYIDKQDCQHRHRDNICGCNGCFSRRNELFRQRRRGLLCACASP